MKKRVLIILIVIMAIVLGFILLRGKSASAPDKESKNISSSTNNTPNSSEVKNSSNKNNENKVMELQIKTTKEGTGDRSAKNGDTVSVQYTGKLMDGTKFDSSYDHGGQPFSFTVGAGEVIKGWDQGILGAKVGEQRTLIIPSELGYGSRGVGPIPPNATLVFDIEVVLIK